jgi:hypothetical protein
VAGALLVLSIACSSLETPPMNGAAPESSSEEFFDVFSHLRTAKYGNEVLVQGSGIGAPAVHDVGNLTKILDVQTPDGESQPFNLQVCLNPSDRDSNFGGPIIAVLEWGTGGGLNTVEFDVPTWVDPSILLARTNPLFYMKTNAVTVGVTASAFTLSVRNDGSMRPILTAGAANIGSGRAARVTASVGRGSNSQSLLRRTIYLCNSALANGANVQTFVPPFSRRVWFPRVPGTTATLQIRTFDAFTNFLGTFDIPANSQGPFELSPQVNVVNVLNNSGADITMLNAVFDLEIN